MALIPLTDINEEKTDNDTIVVTTTTKVKLPEVLIGLPLFPLSWSGVIYKSKKIPPQK